MAYGSNTEHGYQDGEAMAEEDRLAGKPGRTMKKDSMTAMTNKTVIYGKC